ncbi:tail fiber domain-containing protein [Paraburkholderia strydomiana]|uniref:tail fiber domain-containing protein n=1 Tax=Paraburkholderia strydomiana TaxID=1245417 RepID=UPI0038BBFCEF
MTALQKVLLGTPPKGEDGDSNRTANVKLNANIDVLNTQATLTSSSPAALRDLTAADMGKRMNFAPTANSTSRFPAAATTGVDQIVSVHNLSTTFDITMDVAAGSGDTAPALVVVKPGELLTWETDGVAVWRTIGRKKSLNETVQGSLTVAGSELVTGSTTVGGSVSAGGKINGVNSANLLFNGSAEFGSAGWSTSNFAASSDSNGMYWINAAAINATTEDVSQNIVVGANIQLALSYMIYTAGVTAGRAYVRLEAFNSSNVSLGSVGAVVQPAIGQGWAYYSMSGTTPAGTTYIRVHRTVDTSPVVSASGVAFGRIKVERGTASSLYSQEPGMAYLQGAPALSGRPTFAGKTPWDNGNLVNPATLDTAQTFTAAKTFAATTLCNGQVTVAANSGGSYTASTINLSSPNVPGFGFNAGGFGATLAYAGGSPGAFQFMDFQRSSYYPIVCSTLTQASDAALKTDITPQSGVLEKLRDKRTVSYVLKSDPSKTRHVGVIAQEWQQDFPELVADTLVDIDEDGDFIAHQYDEAGKETYGANGKPESRQALGFNYANASAVALQAAIELQDKLDAALKRISALEAKA